MRRARPSPETDHFQRDRTIQAFLPGAIDHALSAATNLLEQLVVATLHLDPTRPMVAVVILLERSQPGFEQTHATKSARRIGKNCRTAFCTDALKFINLSTHREAPPSCTDPNFVGGYV